MSHGMLLKVGGPSDEMPQRVSRLVGLIHRLANYAPFMVDFPEMTERHLGSRVKLMGAPAHLERVKAALAAKGHALAELESDVAPCEMVSRAVRVRQKGLSAVRRSARRIAEGKYAQPLESVEDYKAYWTDGPYLQVNSLSTGQAVTVRVRRLEEPSSKKRGCYGV